MAKKRKPWFVKLFLWLFSIVLVLVLLLGGACLFVKLKYDVSVFSTIAQVKVLNQEVNEDELFKNKFSDDDMSEAKVKVDANLNGLITGSKEEGFSVTPEHLESTISASIYLTDKQIGAMVQTYLKENPSFATLNIGGNDVKIEIVQIKFDNIVEKSVDVNLVIKIDTTFLKNQMNSFPLSLFNGYIPKTLYISSTNTITKGENAFEYQVKSKEIKFNKLSASDTASLLKTLNIAVKFGTSDELNEKIGKAFADTLIGSESAQDGMTYLLKSAGVKDFNFQVFNDENCYVIKA